MSRDQKKKKMNSSKYASYLPGSFTGLMKFLSQSPQDCFVDRGKFIWNSSREANETRITKTVWKERKKWGESVRIRGYIYTYINQKQCSMVQDKEVKWNVIENLSGDQHKDGQLTFVQSAKIMKLRKDSLPNKCCWRK